MFYSLFVFCVCVFYLLYFGLFSNFFFKDDFWCIVWEFFFEWYINLGEYKLLILFWVCLLVNYLWFNFFIYLCFIFFILNSILFVLIIYLILYLE